MLSLSLQLTPLCCTNSALPHTKKWLQEEDHEKALLVFARNKKTERYRSVVDFVFAETFTHERYACFRYYEGKGPKLIELRSPEMLSAYDHFLVRVLKLAYEMYQAEIRLSWTGFQNVVWSSR